MAHGFLQSFDHTIEVYSGGTEPAAQVNAKAVEMMKEVRIDISSHVPTHVNTYLDQEWDYVITVCGDMLQVHQNSSIRNSAVYATKSKNPLPVFTSLKSEKKHCPNALVEAIANITSINNPRSTLVRLASDTCTAREPCLQYARELQAILTALLVTPANYQCYAAKVSS